MGSERNERTILKSNHNLFYKINKFTDSLKIESYIHFKIVKILLKNEKVPEGTLVRLPLPPTIKVRKPYAST
jgi:dihydrodipicolinate synthase/N-acetylneuraminate lyase